ncbi:MAG TPA: winged helix-turn-helix domain-containing protein [Candidatus Acidoferrum sp.]|nr:winged helix-turn-helix domain-containing protein [Candidatus Acidoferrum sp.]
MAPEIGPQPRIIRFATFEVDLQTRELRKSGLKLKLQGQPFEVLAMLLERPGELVAREQLRERLWPTDTFVDFDHGVNTAINRLREALGDSADNPRFIETLPRRGYRFIAPVESNASPAQVSPAMNSTVLESQPVPAAEPAGPSGKWKKFAWILAPVVLLGLLVAAERTDLLRRLSGQQPHTPIQSIAVLPLVNLSNDVNQDYFADGMTEALTTDLGKISALRVISRTSVMQYKGTKKSLPEIAHELQVDALVEGTVSRAGNHMRITANLVQASPEKHLWAETYENEVGDILTVQTQVAQAVAKQIQVKLTPAEQKLLSSTRPVNPEAHDDYLKGRYLCNKDTREGLDKAIPYFRRAIKEAPDDPLGYAGMAVCYSLWAWAGDMYANDLAPKDFLPDARDAALKALQLDASLAEAHTALANVRMVLERNWTAAEIEFKQAIQLNPSYSPAHTWYAHHLVATGRADEGVAEAKRALELDPFSAFTRDFAEWACFLARRYDLSIQQSRKSTDLSPEFPWALYDLGQAYEGMGRTDEAIQAYLKAEEVFGMNQDRLRELRKVYQQSGEKAYWRKTLELCVQEFRHPRKFASVSGFGFCDYMQSVDVSEIHLRLGDHDAAFRYLETADTNRDADILYLNVDPHWDTLRSDPRFADLVRRLGLPH